MNLIIIANDELCDNPRYGGLTKNSLEILRLFIIKGASVYSSSPDVLSVDGVIPLNAEALESIQEARNHIIIVMQEYDDEFMIQTMNEPIEYKQLCCDSSNVHFLYKCRINPRPELLGFAEDIELKEHCNWTNENIRIALRDYSGRYFATMHDQVPHHAIRFLTHLYNRPLNGNVDMYAGLYLQR
jgi:hypothetical protein